ncbi:MAG: tripartite tricarboxylate transporter TctB family protein [Paracoccus sp. (in: a-proteobacteria)]|uniref:tripartite tricarboxylate transporter TctB family protein n=1 Tax=Paracoccus sp. TaxID=267 RepID=UPI00391B8AAD
MNTAENPRPEDHDDFGKKTLPLFRIEIVVGVILLVIVGIYLRDASALPASMNPSDVGAGRFPMIAGGATAIALVVMLAQAVLIWLKRREQRLAVIGRPLWVLAGMGLLVLQAAVFELLGAIPVIFGSAVLIMLACGERRPAHLVLTPVVLTVAIYSIFTYALGIRLP